MVGLFIILAALAALCAGNAIWSFRLDEREAGLELREQELRRDEDIVRERFLTLAREEDASRIPADEK